MMQFSWCSKDLGQARHHLGGGRKDCTAVAWQSGLLGSRQRLSGVDNDRRLIWMMVVLFNRVHGVVGVGPFLVDTLYSAVAYGAAIVPGNFRTYWDRLERSFLRCSHDVSPARLASHTMTRPMCVPVLMYQTYPPKGPVSVRQ